MIGAIYLSVKQNEWHGFLPPLAALLGIFNLDRLAALKIAALMGYVLAPCTAQRSLTLLSILYTHRIAAGYFLSPPGMDPFMLTVKRAMGAALPLTPVDNVFQTTS